MNVRTYITLDITREDRIYVLSIPYGAKFQEAHEVSQEFAAGIIEMAKQAEEQAKADAEKENGKREIIDLT